MFLDFLDIRYLKFNILLKRKMHVSEKYCLIFRGKIRNTVQYSKKIPFVIGKLILRKPLKFHRREIKRAKTFIT